MELEGIAKVIYKENRKQVNTQIDKNNRYKISWL